MEHKKRRERRRKWLRSPEGIAYVLSLRERSQQDAREVAEILKEQS